MYENRPAGFDRQSPSIRLAAVARAQVTEEEPFFAALVPSW